MRIAGAADLPADEHAHAPLAIGGLAARAIRTDVGIDLLCDAADTGRAERRARGRGRRAGLRGRGRDAADRARAPALRSRPRRHRDPAGGRAERARGVVHEGLLRRAGDSRAAPLPRQAEPPAARAAPLGARERRRRAHLRRTSGRPGRERRPVARPRPDRAGARPARGRSRLDGRGRRDGVVGAVVELPFR